MNVLKKLYCSEERNWGTGICSFKVEEFGITDLLSRDYDVKELCSLMGISRFGYYKWKKRDPSERDISREKIIAMVKAVHEEHRCHGYRWGATFLRCNCDVIISDNYIYKCFRYLGIVSETKHKVRTSLGKE